MAEVFKKHPSVSIVSDSIYDRILFSGKKAPHILSVCPELKDQVLEVNGASKNYLMTGWRLGWMIGDKNIVKTLSAFQSQSIGCPNSIAQKAFEDAVDFCEEDLKNMVKDLKILRNILKEGLKEISGLQIFPSEGAFYLWVGVKSFIGKKYKNRILDSSQTIMEQLLSEKKLLCICGEEFGAPGYIRFSYVAKKEEMEKAVVRLKEFFSELT